MKRPHQILLDLSGIIDAETLHEYLSKKLNLPSYYGFNFDAFEECINDTELNIMPKILILEGLEALGKYLPNEYKILISCFKDYEAEYQDQTLIIYRQNSPSGQGIEFENE